MSAVPKTAAAPIDVDLLFLINQAGFALNAEMTKELGTIGISPREFCVLSHALKGETTQIRLAELSALDKTTMVATLDKLERAGLAERKAAVGDRRARIVDAAVREIAEHGYDQADEEAIAERAGVTPRVFFDTFAGKEEALLWAYDIAAAYAIPQILRALREGDAEPMAIAARLLDEGASRLIVTETSRDGTLAGPDLEALATLRAAFPDATLVAAGGVGSLDDLRALDAIGIDGAVVGLALLTGAVDPAEAVAALS